MRNDDCSAGPLEAEVRKAAPEGWDAEFLAKRLGRVARIAGVPMPERMTYEQIAEVAGTILGQIAGALKFQRAKAGWQPIETAPKDGTAVLVYPATWGSKPASIAKWNEDKYAKKPCPYWNRDDDLGKVTISRDKPPTHWMSLPAPPSNDNNDASAT